MDKTQVHELIEIIDQRIDRLFEFQDLLSKGQEQIEKAINDLRLLAVEILESFVGCP